MITVPRPERTPEQVEINDLRALLAAVADVLDVPVDAGATVADRRHIVSDRATLARIASRTVTESAVSPTVATKWLREELAKDGGR